MRGRFLRHLIKRRYEKSLGYFKNLRSLRFVCHFSFLIALSLPVAAFASTAAANHQGGSTVVNAKQTQQQTSVIDANSGIQVYHKTNQHLSNRIRPIISADLTYGYGFIKKDYMHGSEIYEEKPVPGEPYSLTDYIDVNKSNTAFGGKLRFGLLFYNQNSWAFSGGVGFSALFYDTEKTSYYARNKDYHYDGDNDQTLYFGRTISIKDRRTYDITVGGTVYKSLNKEYAFEAGGTDIFARADAGLRVLTYEYRESSQGYNQNGNLDQDNFSFTSKLHRTESLDVKVNIGIQHNFTNHFGVHGIFAYDYGSEKDTEKQAGLVGRFLIAGVLEFSAGASYIF